MPSDLDEYKPATASQSENTSNFSFAVKWKNSRHTPEKKDTFFSASEIRNWDDMKNKLKGNGAVRVSYLDGEGDEIPIESQCEFQEFLKYCKKNTDTRIIVEKLEILKAVDSTPSTENFEEHDSREIADLIQCQRQNKMAPKELDVAQLERSAAPSQLSYSQTQERTTVASSGMDGTEFGRNATQLMQLRYNGMQTESSGDTAPKWFTNYMQTMKAEMVTEISQRVTAIVMDLLSKKRESQYDSASSHPHVSDSEYLLDSDLEDRVSLADQAAPSYFPKNREKKLESCSRPSGGHRVETARRSYRHTQEKQRKKRSKNPSINHPPNSEEIWHSPSFNRRRGEKTARNKREHEETRLSQNAARSELISLGKSVGGGESLGEELESSHRRTLSSGMKRSSSTPAPSAEVLEPPILKLRLANPYSELPNEPEVRMGCSVTGQDLLERPNDRVPAEYCALSDSDNISIISDVSHNSEKLRRANDFEMVLRGSSTFTDEIEDDLAQIITTEFPREPQEPEDQDNARDSSSFELLSEPPPSPPLSIHMDEDHFATATNETSNYNINDETTIDKRGNQSKIDKCPYAIDAHGKIYQQNIMDGGEECAEIVLEKRTGGAYSFVGEALPAPTKEGAALFDNSESTGDRIFFTATEDDVTQDAGEATEENERPAHSQQSRGLFHNAFYDSTQSFHSHTAQQAEHQGQDSSASAAAAASRNEETARSHVFVDHNASKGLGDTKRSSPKKHTSATNSDKSSEDSSRSERRSSRRSSQDSHGSANRNNSRNHDPRSRRFANWSTTRSTRMMDDLVFNAVDPMHILPETLVTGAVHVASSAYTTARRVYDKILTAQMVISVDSKRRTLKQSLKRFGNILNADRMRRWLHLYYLER